MAKQLLLTLLAAGALAAQPAYDLLLKGGHVIDPKNKISKVMDVAVSGGKIARLGENLPAAQAKTVADVSGLYVTPGLIDLHVHVYSRPGGKGLTGSSSVAPEAFSFRSGVTTMVDAGTSGWRTFPEFRQLVLDQARTRVLALLNIVGHGMGPEGENDPTDMDPEAAAKMARAHPDRIVGFKTAHYAGPGWASVENAVKAGNLAGVPVMVDFGYLTKQRTLPTLLLDKLRPGDIYTHCYSGHREELLQDGRVNPAMVAARQRGVIFDVGHGAGSFYWYVAIPSFQQKFPPDSISTDLHSGSMNAGMKDMTNVMSKILNLGSSIEEVIQMSTWNPARQIQRPQLGNLDVGAEADIAVLRLDRGAYGFIDSAGAGNTGNRLLVAEITVRAGRVVWDLNARAAANWKNFPYQKKAWVK